MKITKSDGGAEDVMGIQQDKGDFDVETHERAHSRGMRFVIVIGKEQGEMWKTTTPQSLDWTQKKVLSAVRKGRTVAKQTGQDYTCLLYTSPSPRD